MFAVLILSGCVTVGPDYVLPETKIPAEWHNELKRGGATELQNPQGLAKWWTTLNDPIMSGLIDRAVVNNPDIRKVRAKIREQRARRNISNAGLFPTINASGSFTRRKGSEETGSGKETDFYSAGFDAGWELDLFGGTRRSVEASTADLQASREDLRDVLVSLLAEIALNYVEVRSFQSRLEVAEKNLKIQDETYQLAQLRYQAGLANEFAVHQAKYNLENTRSNIPTLRSALEEAMNRLAVLMGDNPGTVHSELKEHKPIPVSQPDVVVGIPADVLRQRPDIRRAERQLAAQTARVGVATAEMYPKINLTGSIGFESLTLDNLITPGSKVYSFGPRITWPIFKAGSIRSNIEVQSALQEQYLILYESAVLNALEEVENALVAYMEAQNRRQSLSDAKRAASQAAVLAQDLYKAGLTDFTSVLDAQRSLLAFDDQLIQSEGNIISNLVRLYKALGGGWSSLAPGDINPGSNK
ncbi:MAG: efflux transporter outer membrane subunit [Proteobacteria bacterium]|nr:efflux transporter outer membrane subunit [Pseudomonadota bacterium]MBU1712812.1 efflux transporter outer membrane subunit [Pseudomonadota bacterium]